MPDGASLSRAPLLAALAAPDLAALGAVAEARRVPEGGALFRRGDAGDGLWVLTAGEVRIRVESAEGAEVVLNHLGPGDAVGEVALLDGGARSADAVAASDVEAVFLPREAAMGVLAARPDALLRLLGVLCGKLRAATAQVESTADGALRQARRHGAELEEATDRNPLTRLPGNQAVRQAVERLGVAAPVPRALCYLDLDHFKPFNDAFGFRTGDEALFLCATVLRRCFAGVPGCFLGHIGGDDFFAGFEEVEGAALEARLAAFREAFMSEAAGAFYSAAERAAGSIAGKDRDGNARRFPLLGCSIAMLELRAGEGAGAEVIGARIAGLKTVAKGAVGGIARGGV
ncbi:cyclic nucleotide-binding domain-containing protein [Falsiroseomonas stagni]|uniref:cAMP-binding domain of CRP or a regulatory subunit of cAMP-dependent protein kinases n=1 Tax=Falsiroseomonas stagni DSM 19981 TaxID=1123062 RepID=A0A1I3Z1J3_9PROT|nr:cyclic nucleotide-binding domain-containing protein [Falsiroseomonas stagni]SFK37952.1 cAMP-binding domain of CRP or a regulatory subunit of cAMP-dependent protein kinases [Falsiroseomonas stagni DSM 19981]